MGSELDRDRHTGERRIRQSALNSGEYRVVDRVTGKRANGVSTMGKRIYEDNQSIDPRVSVLANECMKPRQTTARTNESEVAGKRMESRDGDAQARGTVGAVARRSYGKLVTFLVARTWDVAAAEGAPSEAFASALADWPLNGCPSNPATNPDAVLSIESRLTPR